MRKYLKLSNNLFVLYQLVWVPAVYYLLVLRLWLEAHSMIQVSHPCSTPYLDRDDELAAGNRDLHVGERREGARGGRVLLAHGMQLDEGREGAAAAEVWRHVLTMRASRDLVGPFGGPVRPFSDASALRGWALR